MKIRKRIISFLLAFLMLVSIIPAVDFSADAETPVFATDIVAYARQYIGYPYRLGTKGPNSFDCAGFVNYVFKHFGIDLPTGTLKYFYNPTDYGTVIDTRSVAKAKMGDIIAWEGHVAIYTEDGYCVEALGTNYGVCEQVKVDRHFSNGPNYKVIRINGVYSGEYPVIKSVSNVSSGVQIDWYKYNDCKNYRVYRKTSGTDWVKVADVASTSFVDTTVKSGTKYTYTVRAISADGKEFISKYDTSGKSITYLSPPMLKDVSSAATGVKISWHKLSGAAKYRVFYKTGSGGWTKIADTTSTSYTWTGAKSGTNYRFTVRCITSDGKSYTSGYDSMGLGLIYIAAPAVSSVEGNNSGVNISWKAVNGAVNYKVFRKTASTGWTSIGTTTSTSFTDKTAVKGMKYSYTVRCVTTDGKVYMSGYDSTGKSITSVDAPVLSSVYANNSGVYISWEKANKAEKYRVFYKTNGDSSWTKIADTAAASYTWTGAKNNTDYTFTVRCITSDGKGYTSGYDTNGLTITPVAAPVLSSVAAENKGNVIKWKSVNGAENYKVFRKVTGGNWIALGTTASTLFTDTSAEIGTKYTYTVRCLTDDGKVYTSGYDSTGKSITSVSMPELSSVTNTAAGVKITWSSVKNAEKYRVFYKTSGESTWNKAGDTTSASYTWTGAQCGTDYDFTVRCVTSDGKMYTSGYDAEGISVKYLSVPKLSSVSNTAAGVQIAWDEVMGAENYRVFYKIGNGSWTKIADTADTSYTWTDAESGTDYKFTVRCVSEDGNSYTSDYDSAGMSLTYIAAPILSSVTVGDSGIEIS